MTDLPPASAGSSGLRLGLRVGAFIVALLGLFPLANLLTVGRSVPWWQAAVWGWVIFGGALAAVSLLLAFLLRERLDNASRIATAALLRPSPRAFGAAAAAFAFVLAGVMSRYAFAGQPYTGDEMAQQWHARILLAGRLSAVAEPWPEFFNTAPVFDRDGSWFSQYPIGGPALLALGMRFGAAWLVNPILLAVATWGIHRFLARTTEERLARVATLLFVTSPMVLVTGGSQMNHVPALAFGMLALAALARWDGPRKGRGLWPSAAAIGCSLGLVALFRPLDAAILITLVAVFQLCRSANSSERWLSLGVQVAAGALPVALLLWVNSVTTGSPLLFAYDALNGAAHGPGFHIDPNGELHTPLRGLAFMSGYLMRLARYLFEWPLPATLWIAAGLAAAVRVTRWDALLAGLAAAFLLAHGAYWFEGFFAGPRFLFTALPAFIYFAARAPFDLGARSPIVRRAMLILVPASVLWTWSGVTGDSTALGRVASYHEQRTKLKTDIEGQIARQNLDGALVFVNESWRGRLLARLRVLGVSQFRAERVLNEVDACAIQTALDGDTVRGPDSERAARIMRAARSYGAARLQPGQESDRAIALVPGTQPTAVCLHEFLRDTLGTMPYSLFLARQQVEPDGRVGGAVVFARDLGSRNELLRERFGDRRWYRYRPGRSADDTMPVFLPLP